MFESAASSGDKDEYASLVPPGTPVLDLSGEAIGSTADLPPEDGCLPVYKGLFFPRLIYIPTRYVVRTDSYGAHLSLRKSDLDSERYADPVSAVALSAC